MRAPNIWPAFFKLLVKADMAAARHRDRALERHVDTAWSMARGAPDAARCTRGLTANGERLRCILTRGHRGPCETWLHVSHDPGGEVEIRELREEDSRGVPTDVTAIPFPGE